MKHKLSIGIVGTGRFGQVLKQMFASPGFECKQSSLNKPIDRQFIFPLKEVLNSDIVFLAIPISVLEKFLQENAAQISFKTQNLFIEVCSVNKLPNQWLQSYLPPQVDLISSHPLFGPISSKNGTVFKNLDFIYWPTRIRDQQRLAILKNHLNLLGLRLTEITPDEHDQIMAKTQAVAFLYGKLGIDLGLREPRLNTPGYQAIAENQYIVSHDSPQLFWDMFRFNPYAREILGQISTKINDYKKELAIIGS